MAFLIFSWMYKKSFMHFFMVSPRPIMQLERSKNLYILCLASSSNFFYFMAMNKHVALYTIDRSIS